MKITHTRVSFKDGRYHRAIPGEKSISIPHSLFDTIVAVQTVLEDLHLQARRYGVQIGDKPFTREKNHRNFENEVEPIPLEPGVIVTFNQDEADSINTK
jgi:hypothetical protein